MRKEIIKTIIRIIATIILIVVVFTAWAAYNKPQVDENSLWHLVTKMDDLRNLKNECANNLWIKDSAKFLQGYTWYCDSWDDEIKDLRNQINELQKKDYEGLAQSR